MDVELREALTHGFGPEPVHPPVAARLSAGHRAVRRRRIAGSVLAVAMTALVGAGAAVVVGSDGPGPSQVASGDGSDGQKQDDELAWYDEGGNLRIRSGATVVDRVDSPFPPSAGMDHSVALAVEHQGEESWLLLTWTRYEDGSQSESGAGGSAVAASGSFRDWVADQVRDQMTPRPEDDSAGYIGFADDGTLTTSHGVEILDQLLDPAMPEGFAPEGARVAAALLREPDGKRFFVMLVETDGSSSTDAEPRGLRARTLQEFLEVVRADFLDGEDGS